MLRKRCFMCGATVLVRRKPVKIIDPCGHITGREKGKRKR